MTELLSNLKLAQEWIESAIADLEGDPALEENAHWRENLAQTGYQVETLLSEEA